MLLVNKYSKCGNVVLFPSNTMTVYIISISHITLYSLQCSFMTFKRNESWTKLTAAVGSLCVQATGRRSFQSVSPSNWSVLRKQEPLWWKTGNKMSKYSTSKIEKCSLVSLIIVSGNILNIPFDGNVFLVNSRGQCDSKRHVSVLLNSLFSTFTHLMQCLNWSTVFTSQTELLFMQTTPVSLKLVLPLERVTHPAPTHLKICRSAIQPWTLNNCLMVSICGADNNASLPVILTHQALLATSTPQKENLSQAEFQHWKKFIGSI